MKTHGIADGIKQEIAAAIVRESHPGWDRHHMGESYVVDTDGDEEFDAVIFKGATAQWNPWPDNATALSLVELYQHCEGDIDFSPISEDGEDMTEDAEALALEYMPDYYPPFDTNEDDEEGEEDRDEAWDRLAAEEAQIKQWEYEEKIAEDLAAE